MTLAEKFPFSVSANPNGRLSKRPPLDLPSNCATRGDGQLGVLHLPGEAKGPEPRGFGPFGRLQAPRSSSALALHARSSHILTGSDVRGHRWMRFETVMQFR